MTTSKTISPSNASFPAYLDFGLLRQAGIEHCQALASDLWTDFNLHDPGVTILEVLCYALTDLGYRTNFPIADLVARDPAQRAADTAAAGPDGKPYDDNFFTPEQILTCNPVTLLDLRKLLIDVPGVRNAWIERAERGETRIFVNDETDKPRLQYEEPVHLANDADRIEAVEVKLDGLYIVCLELEDAPESDACGNERIPADRILDDVWTLLHRHRNLCEDFLDVVVLGDEHISICADIEIADDASPEDVLLGVHKSLRAFLSPTLRFYSLQEMLARGRSIEEIYAGRPLTPLAGLVEDCPDACSHGFIDTEELEATERRATLHASELLQVVMDVPGVLAVRKLLLVNYLNGIHQTLGEKWCLHLTEKHRPLFDLTRSQIKLFKGSLPFSVDKDVVEQRYREERDASTKAPREGYQLDRAVPEGTHRDLDCYRSIVHEFPLVYGIGDGHLADSAPAERKAQVHQLRAYLLFFDQLLANYLAQLANLRELFSLRPDNDPHRTDGRKNRTYFTQKLRAPGEDPVDEACPESFPDIDEIVRNHRDCDFEPGYPKVPDNYREYLDFVVEDESAYRTRRNGFLDHLLARFAESFSDYVLLMFDVNGRRNDDDRIILDKTEFLTSYPETSRDRGRGFDQRHSQGSGGLLDCAAVDDELEDAQGVWNTDNVAGLQKRVARLLGFGNTACATDRMRELVGDLTLGRRTLGRPRVVEVAGGWHFSIELESEDGADPFVLKSRVRYGAQTDARTGLAAFLERANDEAHYRRLRYAGFPHFGFEIVEPADASGEPGVLATFPSLYAAPRLEDADRLRDEARELVVTYFAGTPAPTVRTEPRDGLTFFVVEADIPGVGEIAIQSTKGYASDAAARRATDTFLLQAANAENYRNITDTSFDHYGFAVVDEDDAPLVEAVPPWPSREERDLRLFQLLRLAIGGAITCVVFQREECFFGQLLDVTGATVLLEAVRGFPTADEARVEFDDVVLARAAELEHYRDLDGDDYGFELSDAEGLPLASHPQRYATDGERDTRRLALWIYVTHPTPILGLSGPSPTHGFTVLARDTGPVFESAAGFESGANAKAGFAELLNLAHHTDFYRRRDDMEGDLPYGFELVDRAGSVLVRHPASYASAEERDVALQETESLFCPVEALQHLLEQGDDGWRVALLDGYGDLSLEVTARFESKEAALVALAQLIELAERPERYERLGVPDTFGFELHDDAGALFATHLCTYRTEAERDRMLRLLIEHVQATTITYRFHGEPGELVVALLGPDGTELLRGTDIYPDESMARAGFDALLERARDAHRYRPLESETGFTFDVVDGRHTLGVHPHEYATPEERDATIALVLAYVRGDELHRHIANPEGAFTLDLLAADGTRLLEGLQIHGDAEQARAARCELLALARRRERYVPVDADSGPCRWGFELQDDVGLPVARQQRRFSTAAARDAAITELLALVLDWTTISDVARPIVEYAFELRGEDGGALLSSSATYATTDDARTAYARALELALSSEAFHTTGEDGSTQLELRDGDVVLARAPDTFASAEELDVAREAIIFRVRSKGAPYTVVPHAAGGFTFELADASGVVLLTGTQPADDEPRARERLLDALDLAADACAYVRYEELGGYGFRLHDESGAQIADHPADFVTPADRDAALSAWIAFLAGLALEAHFVEVPILWFWELDDGRGRVLLRSTQTWSSAEEAEAAFCAAGSLAIDEASYALCHDNASCSHTFALAPSSEAAEEASCDDESSLVAVHPHTYNLPRERDEALRALLDLVRDQQPVAHARGTGCGYRFRYLAEGRELVSVGRYPERSWALSECTRLLRALEQVETWTIVPLEEPDDGILVAALDDTSAASEPGEPATLVDARDAWVRLAGTRMLPPASFQREPSSKRCEVLTQSGEVLLASPGSETLRPRVSAFESESSAARDTALQAVRAFFDASDRPEETLVNVEGEVRFEFVVQAGLVVRSSRGFTTTEAATTAARAFGSATKEYRILENAAATAFGFEILVIKDAEEECAACSRLAELALDEKNTRLVETESACAYGFEIVDGSRRLLARHPTLHETAEERDAHARALRCAVDAEGFHLVEHLLLRPLEPGSPPMFAFAVHDPDTEAQLLLGTARYPDAEQALAALSELLQSVLAGGDVFVSFETPPAEAPCHRFQLVDAQGATVAEPRDVYGDASERDTAMDDLRARLVELFEGSTTPDALTAHVFDTRTESGRRRDALMPLGSGCRDDQGNLCPVRADPYSFRATVVVPYWPRRFREFEFRDFFERTLRRETPAHVFLRICWVDVCQMNEFEDAYRRWLRALDHPNTDCDRSDALNELIAVLFSLRSVYSTARLFGCEDGGTSRPMILDQTILGTASADHGDPS